MRVNVDKVTINEKVVIDLDNDAKHEVSIFVDTIDKNDLSQFDKDK